MGTYSSVEGFAISFFSKILVIVLFWILLHGIIQNFACSILIFKDDIDIIFARIAYEGALLAHFFQNFGGNADLVFYYMKSHKNLYARYTLLEIKILHFRYV